MLTQFPGTALLLFGLLFGCGILFVWISDKVIGLVGFAPCESCLEQDCTVCLAGMENDKGLDEIFYPMNLRKNIKSLSFTRFLFTVSFVQDGHGMLPMLSYSIKDSILIKGFNLVFGVALGSGLFAMGF